MITVLAIYLALGCGLWVAAEGAGPTRIGYERLLSKGWTPAQARRFAVVGTIIVVVAWPIIYGAVAIKLLRGSSVDLPQHKHGRNDLGRWKQYGGKLERPAPPPPSNP